MLKPGDFRKCFSGEIALRVLEHLDVRCGLNENPFDKDSSRATDYRLGVLGTIQYIHEMINDDSSEVKHDTDKKETS